MASSPAAAAYPSKATTRSPAVRLLARDTCVDAPTPTGGAPPMPSAGSPAGRPRGGVVLADAAPSPTKEGGGGGGGTLLTRVKSLFLVSRSLSMVKVRQALRSNPTRELIAAPTVAESSDSEKDDGGVDDGGGAEGGAARRASSGMAKRRSKGRVPDTRRPLTSAYFGALHQGKMLQLAARTAPGAERPTSAPIDVTLGRFEAFRAPEPSPFEPAGLGLLTSALSACAGTVVYAPLQDVAVVEKTLSPATHLRGAALAAGLPAPGPPAVPRQLLWDGGFAGLPTPQRSSVVAST